MEKKIAIIGMGHGFIAAQDAIIAMGQRHIDLIIPERPNRVTPQIDDVEPFLISRESTAVPCIIGDGIPETRAGRRKKERELKKQLKKEEGKRRRWRN